MVSEQTEACAECEFLQAQVRDLQDELAGTIWIEPPRIPLPVEAPLDSDGIERVRQAMVMAAYGQVAREGVSS